jgi:hypothetical protein
MNLYYCKNCKTQLYKYQWTPFRNQWVHSNTSFPSCGPIAELDETRLSNPSELDIKREYSE